VVRDSWHVICKRHESRTNAEYVDIDRDVTVYEWFVTHDIYKSYTVVSLAMVTRGTCMPTFILTNNSQSHEHLIHSDVTIYYVFAYITHE